MTRESEWFSRFWECDSFWESGYFCEIQHRNKKCGYLTNVIQLSPHCWFIHCCTSLGKHHWPWHCHCTGGNRVCTFRNFFRLGLAFLKVKWPNQASKVTDSTFLNIWPRKCSVVAPCPFLVRFVVYLSIPKFFYPNFDLEFIFSAEECWSTDSMW